MPLKAPAEKAILGANQFKFQLTQDRKAAAALTSLAVHAIAGLIIFSFALFQPNSSPPCAHTLPLSFCHPWGEVLITAFSWKQFCVIIGVHTVSGCGLGNAVHLCPCVHTYTHYTFHTKTQMTALVHRYANIHTTHTRKRLCLPAGFSVLMGRNTSFNQTGQLRTNFSFVVTAWGPQGLQSLYWQSAANWLFVQKLLNNFVWILIRAPTLLCNVAQGRFFFTTVPSTYPQHVLPWYQLWVSWQSQNR